MEINCVMTDNTDAFLERMVEVIDEYHPKADREALKHFAEIYFQRFPLAEFDGRQYKDVYGCLAELWRKFQLLEPGHIAARVFNPNLEENGWLSNHTIVDVLVEDMPFLTDSIRIEFNRRHIPVHFLKSTVLQVTRDAQGKLVEVHGRNEAPAKAKKGQVVQKEALIYFEINRHASMGDLLSMRDAIVSVLEEIRQVVKDYGPMVDCAKHVSDNLELSLQKEGREAAGDLVNESKAFLHWLTQGNFTFLGYAEFDLIRDGDEATLKEREEKRLGIFKPRQGVVAPELSSEFSEGMERFYLSYNNIAFTKSAVRSRIHRSAYSDYVVVKRYNKSGDIIGESRFVGLYTSMVYDNKIYDIPVVRKKVEEVVSRSGHDMSTFEGKSFGRILETFPRDELFQVSTSELLSITTGVAQINERSQVRLFMRKDAYGKFINFLVYVPRDLFSTKIRLKIQDLITSEINALESEFNTHFSESILARAHLVFRVDPESVINVDVEALERKIIDLTRGWDDHFYTALLEAFGEERATKYRSEYGLAFTEGYREAYDARTAVSDIQSIETLTPERPVAMSFYQALNSAPNEIRFKVFQRDSSIELSSVVPILENLGLRVLGEYPYAIENEQGQSVYLHDFYLLYSHKSKVDVSASRKIFQEAFEAIWLEQVESDAFNRLVIASRISWREVSMLRAYARYMKQTVINYSQSYIADTLCNHVEVTRNLVALFKGRFDPRVNQFTKLDNDRVERLNKKILDSLEEVDNLNEDRILRRYLELMNGTLRTNYFQKDYSQDGSVGQTKDYISFKLSPRDIPDIPEPRPMFEIFVYSPRIEGVHLRGGKVARGGLRWSDRLQDYRTEVLGLVKAQQVKNAVIVPNGAKGGFVVKKPPTTGGRKAFMEEGVACYQTFIQGLLDVTDNIINGEVVHPTEVVHHDEDDPYLVVAADKGTATFSDIANEISIRYGHWLGDAFASGGSQGYDHKGMGITARGAWVSVQRHFKEQGVDIQKEDFTVIGVGDMAGDVFGNGMLLSEHIRLCAAFNHMHIFIDPEPNAAKTFVERQRLFDNPQLNWGDYDKSLISKGGGIFSRSAKSIVITPQMKARFSIIEDRLAPTDLIHRLLKAPVDLIWNGGIGTYVKGSNESHSDVGDKANDALRINGSQLRCKVFGEGGNLGMTQLGRVEFCLNGGACNTDFIDNAAGVDCSDHEVNIKILIDGLLAQGDMTTKQRNALLADMTDQVAELVLSNNYQQTQAISVALSESGGRFAEYRRLISRLESEGRLNRRLEYLPDDDVLLERHSQGKNLSRPELSVLISYVKVVLKEVLAEDQIAQDDYIANIIEEAFPPLLREKFPNEIRQHILRREIIATQLANDLVNNAGITYFHRLMESTGAAPVALARAYVTARDTFRYPEFRQEVEGLDFAQPTDIQFTLLKDMIRRVRRGTRWFLRNRRQELNIAFEVNHFKTVLNELATILPLVLTGAELERWQKKYDSLKALGLSDDFAKAGAVPSSLYSGLGLVEAAKSSGATVKEVAHMFFHVSEQLGLNWFARQISEVTVETYWQAMAREAFLDDMEAQMRSITIALLRVKPSNMDFVAVFEAWRTQHKELYGRWTSMMLELQASTTTDFAMFSVAMRELYDLAHASSQCESLDDSSEACRLNV
ncbi:NAD-glutamate dehydrogenase [Marinibactrum halimedae]|uniref:NAD-glutamate dehydrogenase n=1 Tax=Marinibactrum halimedae TaxID=1444977 RepID=UPI001E2E857A|nr:NAD-glutamate dehydrogenase [Marinibactrum halimedae]MCD9458587.1 NAD-glutamate dehydrogenase [Marinibactrum halimedae]